MGRVKMEPGGTTLRLPPSKPKRAIGSSPGTALPGPMMAGQQQEAHMVTSGLREAQLEKPRRKKSALSIGGCLIGSISGGIQSATIWGTMIKSQKPSPSVFLANTLNAPTSATDILCTCSVSPIPPFFRVAPMFLSVTQNAILMPSKTQSNGQGAWEGSS